MPKELQKALSEIQREFTPEDPKVGIIQDWLDKCNYESVCSLMIYREALGNEYQDPKAWELREITTIMNRHVAGWQKHPTSDNKVRFNGYGKQRAWDKIVPENLSPDGFIQLNTDDMGMDFPFD